MLESIHYTTVGGLASPLTYSMQFSVMTSDQTLSVNILKGT